MEWAQVKKHPQKKNDNQRRGGSGYVGITEKG